MGINTAAGLGAIGMRCRKPAPSSGGTPASHAWPDGAPGAVPANRRRRRSRSAVLCLLSIAAIVNSRPALPGLLARSDHVFRTDNGVEIGGGNAIFDRLLT